MKPRILIVEDNPTARKLYRLALETAGYVVVEAADGASALAEIEKQHPALILQDLQLPDMRGLDLLKRIRAIDTARTIPVIGLSGFPSILAEAQQSADGFDATLVKPVTMAHLADAVRALAPAAPPSAIGIGRQVLLVDDDPVQSKLARLRLVMAGFEVMTFSDAQTALAMAKQSRPAVMLADVLMPQMDGFELCAAIRAERSLDGVPVVLMSAHFTEDADKALAKKVGAHALVLRSPRFDEVIEAVRSALDSPPPSNPIELPQLEHRVRYDQQVRRLLAANAALTQRCAHQAAQISIVGGMADALARSDRRETLLRDVLAVCLDAGGVSKAALFRDLDGVLHAEEIVGFDETEQAALGLSFDEKALAGLLKNPRPVVVSSLLAPNRRDAFFSASGLTAAVLIPVGGADDARAALLLGACAGELGDDDLLAFGRVIGAYVAQALALSGAFKRLGAAADADRILFSSLDADKTLKTLGELVVARIGEVCQIDVVQIDGSLRTVASVHSDPAKLPLLRELDTRFPPDPARAPRYQVARTGEPFLLASVTDATRVENATSDEHLALLRGIGVASHLAVPIFIRRRVVGVLSIGSTRPGRRYDGSDIALAQDLAGRAAVALENARLFSEAQEASRAKDEFLATVSHELRTPLNAILGWARMLRAGALPDGKRAHALESVERNAVAQAQLIDDLLDVSRIIAGKMRLDIRAASFGEIVEGALESVRFAMNAKDIKVTVAVEQATPIDCDAERLQQVVWNLLTNATKFTPRGGHIAVTVTESDGYVDLTVKDDGEGIRTHDIARIFERFQQADGAITRTHGGLGLGLAISRHIIGLHGGTIEATSDGPGLGSVFRVRVPMSTHRAAADALSFVTPATRPTPAELVGLQVLIVDDDSDARDLVALMLENCGAKVTRASSVAEAIRHLGESRHDVLLSDIGMPNEDGIALIRRIRAMKPEHGGTIPAAAVTAYARDADRGRALGAGYQMHLAKPFEIHALVSVVATLARVAAMQK